MLTHTRLVLLFFLLLLLLTVGRPPASQLHGQSG